MSAELPLSYRQNPRPVGFEVSYRLVGDRLSVDNGRKETEIALARVEQVRLTYESRSMGQGAYQTSLKLADGTTVKLSSISWRSMFEARRQDAEYSAFVQALLLGVARANPAARFLAGKPRLQWLAMAAVAAVSLVAAAFFIWRAALSGATIAALVGAAVAAAGIWQLEPLVRLNRPRPFTIRELPQGLLP
jgi:O-antigen/teichoic acid export membrane protein